MKGEGERPGNETPPSADRGRAGRAAAGWALVLAALGYAAFVHHGIGPYPDGSVSWWTPRNFLLQQSWIQPFEERPALGVAAFGAPAALLAAAAFWLTRSAVARTLGVAACLAAMLFAFYGLRPPGPQIWSFFGWRGSAVMASLALVTSAALLSPLLARSWLGLRPALRLAVYAPILLAVVAVMRNVTGTDPSLRFAISPWPVVPLFGISIGVVAILGLIAAMACSAWIFAATRLPVWARAGAALVAVAIPPLWFRLWHGSLPPGGLEAMLGVGALCVVAVLLPPRPERLAARGRVLAWGFVLALLPVAAGEALAHLDYVHTREQTARRLITALDAYYEEHQEYPDELAQLVEAGLIERVPEPRIGFDWLEDQRFQYQNFGTSYNLEFSATDWVQCAYNPAWSEEDWDEEEDPADGPAGDGEAEETSLEESWSCPSRPPELW